MTTRYGIQMKDGSWWAGANRFTENVLTARWFSTMTQAELAGLIALPDQRADWNVRPIPLEDALQETCA